MTGAVLLVLLLVAAALITVGAPGVGSLLGLGLLVLCLPLIVSVAGPLLFLVAVVLLAKPFLAGAALTLRFWLVRRQAEKKHLREMRGRRIEHVVPTEQSAAKGRKSLPPTGAISIHGSPNSGRSEEQATTSTTDGSSVSPWVRP